jgi:hypothetical protein
VAAIVYNAATVAKRRRNVPGSEKPKVNRSGVSLHVYIDPTLRKAVNNLLEKTRRSLTSEVEIALEKRLTEEGMWPPQSPKGERN